MIEEVQTSRDSRDGVYRDYCDGDFIRNHPLFKHNEEMLQLVFYFDEVEVANPLGSKRGKHKLGKGFHHNSHPNAYYYIL